MTSLRHSFLYLAVCMLLFSGCGSLKKGRQEVVQKAGAPEPIYPIPTKEQLAWQQMEQYAFVHFGLNTFNDLEWGYGNTPASTFNPTDLDADQWVRIIKAAGFKGVILTAKHHDGFCLWPTKTTEYSVKNSPWKGGKGDMVRDLSDACKRHGLKFGLYLSPWDRNSAHYGTPEYTKMFHEQMRELLTNYGPIFEYWFDGANGGDGWYGGADTHRNIDPKTYYKYEEARELIKELHPTAMIFGGTVPDIRWIGNERGYAGTTNWSPMTIGTPESRNNMIGQKEGKDWLPGECDVSIRPGWFYHHREDHQVKSPATLMDIYYGSVGRNATLLLNFPVGLNGKIHPTDSAHIMDWKKLLDEEFSNPLLSKAQVKASNERGAEWSAQHVLSEDYHSYWSVADEVEGAFIDFLFEKPETLNRLQLQEYIPLGQRVIDFQVYALQDSEWVPIPIDEETTTIGYKRLLRFPNTTTKGLRIQFDEVKGPVCINRIEAFLAPANVTDKPVIRRGVDSRVSIFTTAPNLDIYYSVDGSTPQPGKSLKYSEPFLLEDDGVVKAMAYDPLFKKSGEVQTEQYYLSADKQTLIAPEVEKGHQYLLDNDPYSVLAFPKGERVLEIELDKPRTIAGFKLLPNQYRDGTGHIHSYQVFIDDKLVYEGEFSNIKNNPILQVVTFKPTVGKRFKLLATKVVDGKERVVISDFMIITQKDN